ncbi:MAG: hypothetical protein J4F46_00510 [Dehalococcoidia bacterium]|nr:hypothetical protein [Dehalococcoidia bacterium]
MQNDTFLPAGRQVVILGKARIQGARVWIPAQGRNDDVGAGVAALDKPWPGARAG